MAFVTIYWEGDWSLFLCIFENPKEESSMFTKLKSYGGSTGGKSNENMKGKNISKWQLKIQCYLGSEMKKDSRVTLIY